MSLEIGSIIKGTIKSIAPFGAFVQVDDKTSGLVHISEVSNEYIKDVNDHLKIGDEVSVKVVSFEKGKLNLSIKQALPRPVRTAFKQAPVAPSAPPTFEDMLSKFKKDSDEKFVGIKNPKDSRKSRSK